MEVIMTDQLKKWTVAQASAGQKVSDSWQKYFKAERNDSISRAEEITQTARIQEVQDKHELELLRMDNVVGVAPSLKMKGGKPTGEWSLTVLVESKAPKGQVPKASLVPSQINSVPTDVVEVGKIEALVFNARVRPALPGYSIGHYNITAGTFGCLVRDIRRCSFKPERESECLPSREECPGDYLILSNNHVLAASNHANPGDLILQPGPFDDGVYPSDAVATLERFEPIVFTFPQGYNLVDAAVARPSHSRNVTAAIIGALIPRGIDQAFIGGLVIKAGRTTQVTVGRVLAVNATIAVNYGIGLAVFRHQILTTAMAAGGDSGSLLMDANLNAVGLLFAGSAVITIHNHIADVETALGVRPVTAPRSS
jgi:hypothetical protein